MLQPGRIVGGRYRIGKLIGAGGMGAVYEARHLLTDHAVAIKLLGKARDEGGASLSPLEARVDARVGSPYIVHVHDAGVDDELGVPFIVMELLRGVTLERLLAQRPEHRLLVAEALHLLGQVALGLDAAHSYSVVHCDLKPDNIFVTTESAVKILDFGIARLLAVSDRVTRDLRGTPFYMAPEQARGEPVSPQTDVWAFGLVAYRALTGRTYWRCAQRQNPPVADVIHELAFAPRQPPSARLAQQGSKVELPVAFDAWFLRCLEAEPAARFTTAREAMSALSRAFEPLSHRAVLLDDVAPGSERAPTTQPTKTVDTPTQPSHPRGSPPGVLRAASAALLRRWGSAASVAWLVLGVAYWQGLGRERPFDVALSSGVVEAPGTERAPLSSAPPASPALPVLPAPPAVTSCADLEAASAEAASAEAASAEAASAEAASAEAASAEQTSPERTSPEPSSPPRTPPRAKPASRSNPERLAPIAMAVQPTPGEWPEDSFTTDNVDPWSQ